MIILQSVPVQRAADVLLLLFLLGLLLTTIGWTGVLESWTHAPKHAPRYRGRRRTESPPKMVARKVAERLEWMPSDKD